MIDPDPPPSDLPPPPPFTKSCTSEGKDVFVAAPGPGTGPSAGPPAGVLRSRFATINFDVLNAAATPGDVVRLNLFDDVCFDAVLERIGRSGPAGGLAWVGSIPGEQFSGVTLAYGGGNLSGTISALSASPRSYLVRVGGEPVHAIYEIDQRMLPSP